MLTLVLAVTPLMFLRNMTSLKPVALIGMTTIAALACCIAVRSYQCNFCDNGTSATSENQSSDGDVGEVIIPEREENWWEYATLCGTPKGILNSLPIFICTFVCHFNVLPVHGELRKPTRKRLKKMVHITFGITAFFYTFVGVAGSMFGNCTDGEGVNGNILVNFANDDNLMTVGRFGLMCTITLAFPNLVMPCRDILFRALKTFLKGKQDFGLDDTIHGSSDRPSDGRRTSLTKNGKSDNDEGDDGELTGDNGDENDLSAPLLNSTPFVNNNATNSSNGLSDVDKFVHTYTFGEGSQGNRLVNERQAEKLNEIQERAERKSRMENRIRVVVTLFVFWGAVFVACFIDSVTVVWDILGSSISIIVAFLIPCSAYLVIRQPKSVRKEKGLRIGSPHSNLSLYCGVCDARISPSDKNVGYYNGKRCHRSCMRAGSDIVLDDNHDLERNEKLRTLSDIEPKDLERARENEKKAGAIVGRGEEDKNCNSYNNISNNISNINNDDNNNSTFVAGDISIAMSPFGRARSFEKVTNVRRVMSYIVLGIYVPLLFVCSTNAIVNLFK